MDQETCFSCLGTPVLLGKNGDPVHVKTRKALAILGFACRSPNTAVARDTLADVLWSDSERSKAMQSLRQAMRQLKDAVETSGHSFFEVSTRQVELRTPEFFTDFDLLIRLIKEGSSETFVKAADLWRGDFMKGYEDLDPEFGEWLTVERERIRSQIVAETFFHLDDRRIDAGDAVVKEAAEFLLRMDPALETAHRVLIRYYLAKGQQESAEQQFKSCTREVKLHYDHEPEAETRALLESSSPAPVPEYHEVVPVDPQPAPVPKLIDTDDVIRLPNISILSSELGAPGLDDARYLKEEIVAGLSSYRAYDLFHSDYFEGEEGPKPILMNTDELGSYLLRFNYNDRAGKMSIQFEDRTDGRIVFNEIVDPAHWDSIPAAASQTISRVHTNVIGRLRSPKNSAAFAKWCQAEALMWEFNPESDKKALDLLKDIENRYKHFSMLFSGRAMINMKQLIHYPVADQANLLSIDEILALCEKAVTLDPWQPLNQRAYGWALTQAGMRHQARNAFLNAGRLNTVDPANLMSVAEGLAYSGDVAQAQEKADHAMSLFNSVPRIFYEYYSNVFFAAEDYEMSARLIERASYSSISGLITRIAALVCAGKEAEAIEVLRIHAETYARKIQDTGLGKGDPNEWAAKINFFQDPQLRMKYGRGVDLVRKYFFEGSATLS